MKLIRDLYITKYFYTILIVIIGLFILGYIVPPFIFIAQLFLVAFMLVFVVDVFVLFSVKKGIEAKRMMTEKLSNGDKNPITIEIKNNYNLLAKCNVIDEIPIQFQVRDINFLCTIDPGKSEKIHYTLRPTKRGVYTFGLINVYVLGFLFLVKRRYRFEAQTDVAVYPSFIQMRKYELMAFANHQAEFGLKKIRKIGISREFEQIKEYVTGDDYRTINWKATGRKGELMVNQYEDEKSQHVYNLIDKSRLMRSPFNELTLLDYAINASLVISNIAIKKNDKAGLLTFNNEIDTFLTSSEKPHQIKNIQSALYNIKTNFLESNFGRLYAFVRSKIKRRSLLIIYSNFESLDGMKRQLPYLRLLHKFHLVVVVFFINTELDKIINQKAKSLEEIYTKTIGEKFAFEKRQIVKELNQLGIQTILTEPENLSVNTLNKYLEIKARGLL